MVTHTNMKTCEICKKTVYAMDPQINLDGKTYHNHCAKCADCNCQITISNFRIRDDTRDAALLCKVHYLSRINEGCKNVHMKTRCSSSCVSPYSSEPSTPSRSACSTYDARTLANNSDLSMLNASNNLGDSPLGLLPAHNVRGRKNSSCQSPGTSEIEHLTKYNQNDCSTKNVIDKDGLQGSTQNYSNADFASATTSSDSNDFLIESPQPSTGTNTPDFISNVSSPSKPDDNNCSMKDNPIDNLQNTTDFAASVSSVCGMLVTSYRSNQSSPVLIARKKISNDIIDNSNHIDEDHLREIKNVTSPSAGVQRECHSALGLERFYPQSSKIDFQRINNEKGNVRTIVEFHEAIYISPRRHLDSQIKSKRIVINDFSPVERDRTSLLSTERRVRTQEVILGHRSEDTTPRETILPGLRNRKRIAGYETQKLDTRGSVLNRNLSSPLYFNKSSPLSAHQSSSSGSTSSGTKFALRGSISSSPEATSTSPSPSSSSSNYSPTLGVSESSSICSTPTSASSVLSSSSFCTLRARTGRFYDDSISASPLELNGKDRKCTTSAYGQFLATLSDLSVPSEGNLLEDHQRGDKDNIGITGPRIQTAEERHYQWKLRSIMVEKSLAKLRSAVCSSPDSQKTSNADSQMNLTVINSTRQNVKGKNGEIIAATIRKLLNGKEGYGPVKIRSDLTCDLTNDVSVDAESMFCPSPYEIYLRSKESSLARLPAYKRESNKESYSQSAALALSIENNRYHPSDPTSSTRPLPSSSSAINNSSSNNNRKLSFQSPSIVEKKIVDETHDGSEKNSTDCESSSGRSSPDTISIPSPSLSESPCDSPTFKSYPQSLHKAVTELSYPVQKSSDSVQKSSDSASFVSAVFVLSTLVILLLNLPYSWQWQWRYPNFYPWRDTQSLHHSPWVGELNASAVINQRLLTIETKFEEILQRNDWKLVQKVPFVSVERMIDNDDHRLYFRVMAYFNATPESVIDRLKFPTLDETQKTVDPFHELSTLLFTPSASIQMIRKTTKRPMYLPRREMIGALITKKQSNQIILKNFQIEKIMKNLQINLNSPMAVTKGVLMNALLDVNFNLSSLPFQKEKKNVPFSYEETFYSICRHSYTVLSTFGMKTKRKKSKIRMRNRKYDIFPNSKKRDDGESCLFDEVDNKCDWKNNEKYHTTVHTNCNDGDDHKIDDDDDSNSNSIENKEKNVIINKIKIEDKIKDHKIISKVKNETYVRAHQDMIGWFIPLEDKSTLLLSILHVDLGSDIPEWASEFGVALNIISSTSSFIKLVEGTKV